MLSTGRVPAAVAWAKRGLGEVTVAPVEGWTIVSATGVAQARYPYDDAVRTLAGRPVSWRMRASLGFFRVGSQAVIVLHPRGWRPVVRWLIWTPRNGRVPPDGLPEAEVADVVIVAGLDQSLQARAATSLTALLERGEGTADDILREALEILALPGAELLAGKADIRALPGARVVPPKPRFAREFDKLIDELERERSETEA